MSAEEWKPHELTPEETQRAEAACRALDLAEEKIAEGSEFTRVRSSEFYMKIKERITKYRARTRVSMSQLEWLQDIAERELKRRRR